MATGIDRRHVERIARPLPARSMTTSSSSRARRICLGVNPSPPSTAATSRDGLEPSASSVRRRWLSDGTTVSPCIFALRCLYQGSFSRDGQESTARTCASRSSHRCCRGSRRNDAIRVDTEGICGDAAEPTEGQSADDYELAVQDAIRQAIAQTRADASKRDAAAAGRSRENRCEPAGNQGQEGGGEGLTLTAPSAADLQARADRAAGGEKADAKEQATLARQEAKDRERKELGDRTRQDASADGFQLGQSRSEVITAMAGNGDLFSSPAAAPTQAQATPAVPVAQEKVEPGKTDDAGNVAMFSRTLGEQSVENAFPAISKIDFDVATGQFLNADTRTPIDRD